MVLPDPPDTSFTRKCGVCKQEKREIKGYFFCDTCDQQPPDFMRDVTLQ